MLLLSSRGLGLAVVSAVLLVFEALPLTVVLGVSSGGIIIDCLVSATM